MSACFAPRNPLIEVARFYFVPRRSEPRVSTRIRLAGPQNVLVVAEMNGRCTPDDQDLGRGGYQRLRLRSPGGRARMFTPTPRVQVPSVAAKGETFQVKALISHQMEQGCVVTPRAT